MLPAVVTCPPHLRVAVERLALYCRRLDGTELDIVPIHPEEDRPIIQKWDGTPFLAPCLAAASLHKAAVRHQGHPFCWLEHDSIPLQRGWLKRIQKEYRRLGKEYMLSADSHPPHDLIGGIGVYGPDTHWLVPTQFKEWGWDLWVLRNLGSMLSRTELIQHSYGHYAADGTVTPHRFPKDQALLRADAVIFHRDPRQDLIPQRYISEHNRFLHSGHCGDIIAALPIIRALGGGDLIVTEDRAAAGMRGERFDALKPLLAAQPYITSVEWQDNPTQITHTFVNFRTVYRRDRSLTESQADWLGVADVDMSPWLVADPWPTSKGKIVVARSGRYHNNTFPWRTFVAKYADRLLFVGHREEHTAFTAHCSKRVAYVNTATLAHVAKVIAGADLFVGNQSSPCWIAFGLGKPVIQETHPHILDSRVARDNTRFVVDGSYAAFKELGVPL